MAGDLVARHHCPEPLVDGRFETDLHVWCVQTAPICPTSDKESIDPATESRCQTPLSAVANNCEHWQWPASGAPQTRASGSPRHAERSRFCCRSARVEHSRLASQRSGTCGSGDEEARLTALGM